MTAVSLYPTYAERTQLSAIEDAAELGAYAQRVKDICEANADLMLPDLIALINMPAPQPGARSLQ